MCGTASSCRASRGSTPSPIAPTTPPSPPKDTYSPPYRSTCVRASTVSASTTATTPWMPSSLPAALATMSTSSATKPPSPTPCATTYSTSCAPPRNTLAPTANSTLVLLASANHGTPSTPICSPFCKASSSASSRTCASSTKPPIATPSSKMANTSAHGRPKATAGPSANPCTKRRSSAR